MSEYKDAKQLSEIALNLYEKIDNLSFYQKADVVAILNNLLALEERRLTRQVKP